MAVGSAPEAPGVAAAHGAQPGVAAVERVGVFVVLEGPSLVGSVPRERLADPGALPQLRRRLAEIEAQHAALRPRLEVLGATVIADLERLVNVMHVVLPADRLQDAASLPGVERVELAPTLEPLLGDALPAVHVPEVWAAATPFFGDGVTIGIVDTGIDYLHADFGGSGDVADYQGNDRTVIEPGSFPTPRVVGGWDFAGDDYNPSAGVFTPTPDPDPLDCGYHGSHVAGIAAGGGVALDGEAFSGSYAQSFAPWTFRVVPGVAPRASLYALKVFGCQGSTQLLPEALERAADPDEDGSFDDHLDVVNASLGSSYGVNTQVYRDMADNLAAVGTLFVVAAGNEGATFFVAGSPATLPSTLSVAASVDSAAVTLAVSSPPSAAGDYAVVEGQFTRPLGDSGPVSGELIYAEPARGCEPLDNAAQVAGRIVLIDRGDCPFVDKLTHAEVAGALAAIVVDNDFNEAPIPMGASGPLDSSAIPGVMLGGFDGLTLKAALVDGVALTLSATPFQGDGAELIAGYSSRGPSVEKAILKPEISAPGSEVVSAAMGTGNEPTPMWGTSMATPVVAGAAALVREARPDLDPEEVKAALMNGAEPLQDEQGRPYPASMQGSGRMDVAAAVFGEAVVLAETDDASVAVSFGPLVVAEPREESRTVLVRNQGEEPVTYQLSVVPSRSLAGVQVSTDLSELVVPPGAEASFQLRIAIDPVALGQPGPDPVTPTSQGDQPRHYLVEAGGHVVLSSAGASLRLPYYAPVHAAAERHAVGVFGCDGVARPEALYLPIEGESAHPAPVVTAFELGAVHEADPQAGDPDVDLTDLRAVGVATDAALVGLADASIHFGVAIGGQWTTPAVGIFSAVGIGIDTDGDTADELVIVVEPLNHVEPYADVLVTTPYRLDGCSIYNLDSCAVVGAKRYLNLVPAGEHDTQPFLNGVAVLSAFARDLGLGEEQTWFRYRGFTMGLTGIVERSSWVDFDLAHLRIDTARFAPTAGRPLWSADEPLLIHVGEDDGQPLPSLLLLHHTNAAGQRWETLDPNDWRGLPLAVELSPGGSAARPRAQLTVRNDSELRQPGVVVRARVAGADVELITSSRGSCEQGVEPSCTLGDLDAGSSATVTLTLAAGSDAKEATVTFETSSPPGCMQSEIVTVPLSQPSAPTSELAGGCGCELVGAKPSSRSYASWWLLLGCLALRARGDRRCRSPRSRGTRR